MHVRPFLGLLIVCSVLSIARAQQERSGPAAEAKSLAELKTVAESSNYQATADGSAVELFLKRVQRGWPGTQLETIGHTVEGRAILALVVPPASGTAGSSSPVVTVLLLGGIHSGECDGKEALLALARDMALGRHNEVRKNVRLIFVPNFNADGNERVGRYHRPGQAGPEAGMGVRENAQGLDLNRDFVKLETPECRALLAAVERYKVDALIDTHTTNGSLHRYDLTYAVSNNPATPNGVDAWLREKLLPDVTSQLKQQGLDTFYYGNFEDGHKTWKSFGHEPRYSTEIMGLRGKIGILAESYSYASYQRRIEVTSMFVRQVLRHFSDQSHEARAVIDRAASNRDDQARELPLRGELTQTQAEADVRGYQQADGSPPTPPYGPKSSAGLQSKDYRVSTWLTARATKQVRIPPAYAVPPTAAWALSRLKLHGITVDRLTQPQTAVSCEELVIEKLSRGQNLQNHTLQSLTVRAVPKSLNLPAGTYIVRTSGALGRLAAYLLEPESEDGLFAWNFFDPDLREEHSVPVTRVLGALPSTSLKAVKEIEPGEQLTFDHVMKPRGSVEYSTMIREGANWLEDSHELLMRREQRWLTMDAETGAMVPNAWMSMMQADFAQQSMFRRSPNALDRLSLSARSPDKNYALIEVNGDLYFYDSVKKTVQARQLAALSPTGQHVAYVRDNDLYVAECASGQERRLTKDGSPELLNGILDWVYQEEIYGRGQFRAFWFSPDGQRIAFLQLDQSPVLHYEVPDSISYRQNLEDTRYPKAGDPLPVARMWIASVSDGSLREVDLAHTPADDRLVVRVTWSPDNQLWLQIQNRIQTEQSLWRVDPATGQSARLLHEKSPGWIEVLGQPKFLPNGDFLWLSDLPEGRRHLHRFDMQKQQLKQLTRGAWDISELSGVTPDGRTAMVTGNLSHPIQSQLLSVDTETGQTAVVTPEAGVHRVRLSSDCRFVIDSWSNTEQPTQTYLKSIDGKISRVIGAQINDRHKYVHKAQMQLITIRARDGLELQAQIMLPPDWRAEAARKLPVLYHVYAGPQAPTVQNSWSGSNFWWHQYLCSQGFAVVLCDNRSSRGRGIADTWKIHRDMGRVELQDIEDVVDWITTQPWGDRDRIGIWGWSYGGYMTAYALTHSDRFRAGISGAPVTDWRNYDAVYTERYMDLPQKNEAGYNSSSAVTAAANLRGRLLLIHGERDDNVHISNTLQLAYALQKAGKPFDMMIYPKNRHGVVDPLQRYHLYQTMTEFLERHLKN